jgi:hypothetical protein
MFAYGVIAFELLTGRNPFKRESVTATIAAVLEGNAPSLTVQRPELPTSLAAVLQRCLHRDPRKRPLAREANDLLTPFSAAVQQARQNGLPQVVIDELRNLPAVSTEPWVSHELRSVAAAVTAHATRGEKGDTEICQLVKASFQVSDLVETWDIFKERRGTEPWARYYAALLSLLLGENARAREHVEEAAKRLHQLTGQGLPYTGVRAQGPPQGIANIGMNDGFGGGGWWLADLLSPILEPMIEAAMTPFERWQRRRLTKTFRLVELRNGLAILARIATA